MARPTTRLAIRDEARPTIRLFPTAAAPGQLKDRPDSSRTVLAAEALGLVVLLLLALSLGAVLVVMLGPDKIVEEVKGGETALDHQGDIQVAPATVQLTGGEREAMSPGPSADSVSDSQATAATATLASLPTVPQPPPPEDSEAALDPNVRGGQAAFGEQTDAGGDAGVADREAAGITAVPTAEHLYVQAIVAADLGANVRSGPDTTYPVVGGIQNGMPVTAFRHTNGWLQIVSETGAGGWISADLVAVQMGDIAALPSSPELHEEP